LGLTCPGWGKNIFAKKVEKGVFESKSGWPDDFVKKSPEMLSHPFFYQK
jgi:hypothetical protein